MTRGPQDPRDRSREPDRPLGNDSPGPQDNGPQSSGPQDNGPQDNGSRSVDADTATFEERLLEIGLEEVVGKTTPPDLSARILDAANRRRRSTPAQPRAFASRLEAESSSAPPRTSVDREGANRRRRTAMLLAAAALVATTLIATLLLRDADGPASAPNESIADRDARTETPDTTSDPTLAPRTTPESPSASGSSQPDPTRPDASRTGAPSPSPRYVRFESPLIGLEGEDMREYQATSLVAGDVLVHEGDAPTTMQFGDGAILTISPRTMLEFTSPVEPDSTTADPVRARVLAGEIELATGGAHESRPWLVELPAGELRIAASSRAWIFVERYRQAESTDAFLANLPEIVRTTRKAWHDTVVRIYDGNANGILGDVETKIAAGEEASMWFGRNPIIGDILTPDERQTLETALTSIQIGDDVPEHSPEYYRLSQQADRDADALRIHLADRPAAWNFVRSQLLGLLESPQRTDRYRAYGILFDDPHPWTRGMLEENPDEDLWEPDVLMQLATRGAKFAKQRLRVWVKARSPELSQQVYAALWLALRDDDAGRRVMRKATEGKSEFLQDSNAYFAAAAGLALLGNPEPWRRGVAYLLEEAQRMRPRDDQESIDVRTLRAAYFHRALAHEAIELTSMDDPVLDFVDARRDALADPASLESAIHALEIP